MDSSENFFISGKVKPDRIFNLTKFMNLSISSLPVGQKIGYNDQNSGLTYKHDFDRSVNIQDHAGDENGTINRTKYQFYIKFYYNLNP